MSAETKRRTWTVDEDKVLTDLCTENKNINWTLISKNLKDRTPKQCRERWLNQLDPNIHNTSWTTDDDKLLVELHEEFGNRWSLISSRFPGRSENAIKNRWYSSIGKRLRQDPNGNTYLSGPIKRGRAPKVQQFRSLPITPITGPCAYQPFPQQNSFNSIPIAQSVQVMEPPQGFIPLMVPRIPKPQSLPPIRSIGLPLRTF